jgi:hypothetical protein
MKRRKKVLSEEIICLFPNHLADLKRDYIYFGKQLAVFGAIHEVDVFKTSSTGSSEKRVAFFIHVHGGEFFKYIFPSVIKDHTVSLDGPHVVRGPRSVCYKGLIYQHGSL